MSLNNKFVCWYPICGALAKPGYSYRKLSRNENRIKDYFQFCVQYKIKTVSRGSIENLTDGIFYSAPQHQLHQI